MFGLGWGEILALAVIALVVFGPDQLPKVARQAGNALRQIRRMANTAQNDLRDGLGPEFQDFDVSDLNPRNFVRKHLLEDNPLDNLDNVDFNESRSEAASFAASPDAELAYGDKPPFDPEAT